MKHRKTTNQVKIEEEGSLIEKGVKQEFGIKFVEKNKESNKEDSLNKNSQERKPLKSNSFKKRYPLAQGTYKNVKNLMQKITKMINGSPKDNKKIKSKSKQQESPDNKKSSKKRSNSVSSSPKRQPKQQESPNNKRPSDISSNSQSKSPKRHTKLKESPNNKKNSDLSSNSLPKSPKRQPKQQTDVNSGPINSKIDKDNNLTNMVEEAPLVILPSRRQQRSDDSFAPYLCLIPKKQPKLN
jgi:hypothetical protein